MSNWSGVMLVWASTDSALPDTETSSRDRLEEIDALLREQDMDDRHLNQGWNHTIPCADKGSFSYACESIAVTHWNHFWVDNLFPVLDLFDWGYPDEVEIIWKNEDMPRYQTMTLTEWREKQK